MQEIAEVIEEKGNTVLVRVQRHSGCAVCRQKCGLLLNQDAGYMEMEVDNSIGARSGQKVKLEIADENGILAALIVFVLPLVLMLLGYLLGTGVSSLFRGSSGETWGAVTSLVFLISWFVFVRFISKSSVFSVRFQPRIIEILDE